MLWHRLFLVGILLGHWFWGSLREHLGLASGNEFIGSLDEVALGDIHKSWLSSCSANTLLDPLDSPETTAPVVFLVRLVAGS